MFRYITATDGTSKQRLSGVIVDVSQILLRCVSRHTWREYSGSTLVVMDVLYNLKHEDHHVITGVLLIIKWITNC